MIYRSNLKLLSLLKPGDILTCDSMLRLRLNIGAGASWRDPPKNIFDAINQSFEHYIKMIEIIGSPELVILAETHKANNMNTTLIDNIIRCYTSLRNRLDVLEIKHPKVFNEYVEKTITIEECETALKDIESNLDTIISIANHPDKEKAQQLKEYITILKETIHNCYQTLSQTATHLFKTIVKFFLKLTKPEIKP
jgi:hypothetical protein